MSVLAKTREEGVEEGGSVLPSEHNYGRGMKQHGADLARQLCGELLEDTASATPANYILTTGSLVLFCVVGYIFVSALRFRIQLCRDPELSLTLDQQLSTYVYALPVLAYMVTRNATATAAVAVRGDLCVFGLVSGLIIALYKEPTAHSLRLTVWLGHAKRCVIWVPSRSTSLGKVRSEIAKALNVEQASRIRLVSSDGRERLSASDDSKSLGSILDEQEGEEDESGEELPRAHQHDFFGFKCAAIHVFVGDVGAASTSLVSVSMDGSHLDDDEGEQASKKRSVLSRVFSKGHKHHHQIRRSVSAEEVVTSNGGDVVVTPSKRFGWASGPRQATTPKGGLARSATTPLPPPLPNTPVPAPASVSAPVSAPTPTPVPVPAPVPVPHRTHKFLHEAPKPRKEQVERYVDVILADPKMNLQGIPDSIEKKIYTMAISMALSGCMRAIFSVNGKMLLGHHVEVEIRTSDAPPEKPQALGVGSYQQDIELLVDELLKESMINITWLPDQYEKPLYVNVIMAILTVMNSFFCATKVDMLGFTLEMKMHPSGIPGEGGEAKMRSFADKIGSVRRVSEDILEEELDKHFHAVAAAGQAHWIPDRLERPMFKTLYALILCVTDEILKDMRINFLGDECVLHLVPGPPEDAAEEHKGKHGDKGSKAKGKGGKAATAGEKEERAKSDAVTRAQHSGLYFGQHDLIVAALVGALIGVFLFK